MTFKEKLQIQNPEKISSAWVGGCFACPGDYWKEYKHINSDSCGKESSNEACSACWNSEIPNATEVKEVKEIKDDSEQVIVFLTKRQCKSLADFIDFELMETIRKDKEIDNMDWLVDMCNAYVELKKVSE